MSKFRTLRLHSIVKIMKNRAHFAPSRRIVLFIWYFVFIHLIIFNGAQADTSLPPENHSTTVHDLKPAKSDILKDEIQTETIKSKAAKQQSSKQQQSSNLDDTLPENVEQSSEKEITQKLPKKTRKPSVRKSNKTTTSKDSKESTSKSKSSKPNETTTMIHEKTQEFPTNTSSMKQKVTTPKLVDTGTIKNATQYSLKLNQTDDSSIKKSELRTSTYKPFIFRLTTPRLLDSLQSTMQNIAKSDKTKHSSMKKLKSKSKVDQSPEVDHSDYEASSQDNDSDYEDTEDDSYDESEDASEESTKQDFSKPKKPKKKPKTPKERKRYERKLKKKEQRRLARLHGNGTEPSERQRKSDVDGSREKSPVVKGYKRGEGWIDDPEKLKKYLNNAVPVEKNQKKSKNDRAQGKRFDNYHDRGSPEKNRRGFGRDYSGNRKGSDRYNRFREPKYERDDDNRNRASRFDKGEGFRASKYGRDDDNRNRGSRFDRGNDWRQNRGDRFGPSRYGRDDDNRNRGSRFDRGDDRRQNRGDRFGESRYGRDDNNRNRASKFDRNDNKENYRSKDRGEHRDNRINQRRGERNNNFKSSIGDNVKFHRTHSPTSETRKRSLHSEEKILKKNRQMPDHDYSKPSSPSPEQENKPKLEKKLTTQGEINKNLED